MNQWKPQDWAAIIIALTILSFFLGAAVTTYVNAEKLLELPPEVLKERVEGWRDIILVLIGAIAGYIGGKTDGGS